MKFHISILLFLCCLLLACQNIDSRPERYFKSPQELDSAKLALVTMVGQRPSGATIESRFDSNYLDHYQRESLKYELAHFYPSPDSFVYYQLYYEVPSVFKEYRARAGRYKLENGRPQYYEYYVTHKMSKDSLRKFGSSLFNKLIQKDTTDLVKEDVVEFPDSLTHFDSARQEWIFKYEWWYK